MKVFFKNASLIFQKKEENAITKRIKESLSRFDNSSRQMTYVENFIDELENAGILQHVSHLYMPWLSADADEAFTNMINGAKCTNYSKWSVSNGKAIVSADASTSDVYGVTLPAPAPTINFYGIIRDNKSTDLETVTTICGLYGDNIGIGAFRYKNTSWIGNGITQNQENKGYRPSDLSTLETLVFEIGALSALQNDVNTKINGKQVLVSGSYNYSESLGNTIANVVPSSANENNQSSAFRTIILIGDGSKLTEIQRASFMSSLSNLQYNLTQLEK